jgi:hypothetical protein
MEDTMLAIQKTVLAATSLMMMLAGGAYAASDWLKGSVDEQLKTLAKIQPGLGTIMMEYSNRYTNMYYAAKSGNWGLAGYQLKEALEIQEVGETTRPERARALKAFEQSYLDPLQKAIEAKDFKKLDATFKLGIEGCNGCHAGAGFPFIKYQLPKAPESPLSSKP